MTTKNLTTAPAATVTVDTPPVEPVVAPQPELTLSPLATPTNTTGKRKPVTTTAGSITRIDY